MLKIISYIISQVIRGGKAITVMISKNDDILYKMTKF